MNPFPIFGRTHDQMAEDVVSVVKEFRAIEEFSNLPAQYNIVGHSIGGKVVHIGVEVPHVYFIHLLWFYDRKSW